MEIVNSGSSDCCLIVRPDSDQASEIGSLQNSQSWRIIVRLFVAHRRRAKRVNPKISTIDDYIANAPANTQGKLKQLRALIRKLAPAAQEKISYRMPTFYLNGNLVHFAVHTNHIGFYPTSSGITKFEDELTTYVHAKGSVQFPLEQPLPVDLITRIVESRVAENQKKGESGRARKN